MTETRRIRDCAVCGMFYPSDAETIIHDVTAMLQRVKPPTPSVIVRGMIVPHAGYMYSGFTAAHCFAQLRGMRYRTVIIVSPSHREYFDGISVYSGDGYATPLGTVMLDKELRGRLLQECSLLAASEMGHGEEHAIEVQLPFLQQVLPEFKFLPVVMGDQNRKYCSGLGEALASVLKGEGYLLIASTDLSHYHSSEKARTLDAVFLEAVREFDHEGLMTALETGRTEACGGGPTVAVMVALRRLGVKRLNILHHCNSGDITGDNSRVVGYLSAVGHA